MLFSLCTYNLKKKKKKNLLLSFQSVLHKRRNQCLWFVSSINQNFYLLVVENVERLSLNKLTLL